MPAKKDSHPEVHSQGERVGGSSNCLPHLPPATRRDVARLTLAHRRATMELRELIERRVARHPRWQLEQQRPQRAVCEPEPQLG